MKMKTYEMKTDVLETRIYEVKANSEEEAEHKLYMRELHHDITSTGSKDVAFKDWVYEEHKIITIEEMK